ncbi:GNAT family N-acetyltransferase [Streptacidiphilus neutrinimicus]|uniref:GNAT family N-acetyltransferase n=1 Tax=Streptacidiphilus neutrinimicus TaxID=105420 RepID=UPI0005AB26BF|nr:GNAT family N-acetyltransferase [Streptacidiphilus neutrinimicus]
MGHSTSAGKAAENPAEIEIRVVGDDDLAAWGQALNVGFMRPKGDGWADYHRGRFALGRALGAFDGERCVGTFRSFAMELTLPGGATVVADAVTNVTVSATHRRRGLLNRMMRQDLDAAAARGDAFAMLIAAEFGIYGRYGFGPASAQQGRRIDKRTAGGIRVPAASDEGTIELIGMAEYRRIGPELHDRFRRTRPGAVSRDAFKWRLDTGDITQPGGSFAEPLVALYRDAAGVPAGLLAYDVSDEWRNWLPKDVTLKVRDYFAVDWAAEAALWRYALGVDWVQHVEIRDLAPDSPLPLALHDQRACVDNGNSAGDFLWVRILDVPQAFSTRTYDAPGRVVLEVADAMGYTPGRFVLEAAEDGTGRCVPAGPDDTDVDFALDVSQLAAVCFGHKTLAVLEQAGLLEERREGGLRAAQRVLRTDRAPWCPDVF